MATVISAVATAGQYRYDYGRLFQRPAGAPSRGFPWRCFAKQRWRRLMVMKMKKKKSEEDEMVKKLKMSVEEKMRKKKAEREGYLIAAIVSSFGITSMAAIAVYYRFSSQIMEGGEFPILEMFGTFVLSIGSSVGMEFWARWAHKELWHASLWDMHEGLGITVFGMAYMFVHDGLVHRRFPVGPIAAVPYLRRVAAAHHIHHTDKFDGVPYGLFLGPKELEEVDGEEELQKEIRRRNVYRN
ncbi:beta-carotene 3-hydroxylase 1, chloroplastic isoform X5 [Cucumis melo]|uniref:beta-carotene 3-hydroxylase n=1 Tax=Cucumis melo TaxID=3656 RepID=A0A1S3ATE8_CUCME|nr:beta-carotene 3-hydroxylase 1, chloroplastic isoform X5 [Cucumis melo]